jgi:hypothetical protein
MIYNFDHKMSQTKMFSKKLCTFFQRIIKLNSADSQCNFQHAMSILPLFKAGKNASFNGVERVNL